MDSSTALNAEEAKAKSAAVAAAVGRDVTVFVREAAVPSTESVGPRPSDTGLQRVQNFMRGMEESLKSVINRNKATGSERDDLPDSFYDLTPGDLARLQAEKKEDNFLKTKKHRDAEAAARQARIVQAVIKIQFPDSLIVQAEFKASDKVSVLMDFLRKVISRPQLPFFIYTTPPKMRVKDFQQTLYAAGLAPGALVYFSHETPKGATNEDHKAAERGPFVKPEIAELRDLHRLIAKEAELTPSASELEEKPADKSDSIPRQEPISTTSKGKLPKWFRGSK